MEWVETGKCRIEEWKLSIVFCELLQPVTSALKIPKPSRPTRAVVEMDEDENVEEPPRKEFFTTVAEEFPNRNVLIYKKSTYHSVEQGGDVHTRTSSFLTLSNRRKKAISGQLPSFVPNLMASIKIDNVIDDADPAPMMQLSD